MKAYRLTAWPDPEVARQSIGHRRMLSDMSQRHMSVAQLASGSGLGRPEVRAFIETLERHGLLDHREVDETSDSVFGTLFPIADWLKRSRAADGERR